MNLRLTIPLWLASLCSQTASADTAKLPAVADTNISSHPAEADRNYGQSSHIRLKGYEMLMLIKFDTTPVRGWTVEKARLFLHAAGPHRLKTIGVSTVATDWVEGTDRGRKAADGATFTWADFGRRRWAGPQSDFTDAALTEQGTEVHYADLQQHADNWLEIEVPPRFVHALINGDSFGLAITDEKGQTRANNDVHSREQSGLGPYLIVEGRKTGATPATKRKQPETPTAALPAPPRLNTVNVITWPGGEPPVRDGRLRVWAYGECEKAHPVSGNLLEEAGAHDYAGEPRGDYRRRNVVWDGAASAIHLSAARNEFVAFHLCIEATAGGLRDIRVEADLPGARVEVFRDWYVRDGEWFPEVAVPLRGAFSIPDERNGIAGQRNQSLLVDIYVPHNMPAGRHAGRVRVRADGVAPLELPVVLTIWPFTLPDTLSFDVDLNAYGTPRDPEWELKLHRLAHAHRATLNLLGYHQDGRADAAAVPPLEGSGREMRVKDWTAFDRRFGRYYDGSAFDDLPRKGVPLAHAYLPFCEGWPSDIRKHYRYTPTTTAYPEIIAEHALKAPPIEEALDQQFKDQFVAVLRQFAAHFREKGWSRTQFQFYLNNKYFFRDPKQGGRGSSWWLLDEPMHRDDWLALRFFGQLFKQALAGPQIANFIYRADVSRPQWQRDWLDGLVDLMCVSRVFFEKNDRCMAMKRRGITFWHYGTGNDIRRSNLTGEAWGVKVWLAGGDGFLPWNSISGDTAFERPTPTAILYPGMRFGLHEPLASLRLKAFRRSQQDVEYLSLLATKMGWDRAQTAATVTPLLNLAGRAQQSSDDDAGQTVFENLHSEPFARLRAGIAAALAK
ncbi:MAG: DUF4091 domain-containing protein [Verrucomicrobiae bacterium]|nr:DUF4091 domain-containing protein [Verrucomicrobiae bacterium]